MKLSSVNSCSAGASGVSISVGLLDTEVEVGIGTTIEVEAAGVTDEAKVIEGREEAVGVVETKVAPVAEGLGTPVAGLGVSVISPKVRSWGSTSVLPAIRAGPGTG